MKKIIIIILTIIVGIALWYSQERRRAITPHYVMPQMTIANLPTSDEGALVVDEINQRNDQIKSISYNVTIDLNYRINYALKGSLHYKKPRDFRMTIDSRLARELDMGSNEEQFWFWVKRMDDPGLYYADYQNMYKTNLKTPFNPLWIMQSLGIDELESDKCVMHGDKLALVSDCVSTSGQFIQKVILIDPIFARVIGHYIYDVTGKLIVSSEITDFYNIYFPKQIRIIWMDEGVCIDFYLDEPKLDCILEDKLWKLPNYKPKIEMGKPH